MPPIKLLKETIDHWRKPEQLYRLRFETDK